MRLDSFFNPQRIAIVGASEQGMYPAGVLRNLLDHGYAGEIYAVNPRRATIFGLPAYPDITQTPSPPDLAIIIVPRQAVPGILRQCVSVGVPAAIIITAGFAEADTQGKALQTEIEQIVRESDIAVIGPNCAGLADIPNRVIATRLPAPPQPGPISFVSQSGALMMALYGLFSDRGIGINRLLSLGNQVDVDLAEVLSALATDAGTRVISAFVESVRDGAAFVRALQQALITDKPIVLIKSGRTSSGQQAAATHTAALAGSRRVFDAVCQQYGALRVDDVEELMDAVQLLAAFSGRLNARGHVALVSQSGGLASLSADLLEWNGLTAPPLGEHITRQLRALPNILDFGALGNPTDVRGPAVIGDATADTLAPFLADPDTDVVLLLLAKSSVREQDTATAQAIVRAVEDHGKPLVVVWVGQQRPLEMPEHPLARDILRQAGIPVYDQPSNAIRALARAVKYRRFRQKFLEAESLPSLPHISLPPTETSPPTPLSYAAIQDLLRRYHLPLAPARIAYDPQQAATEAETVGFPVALKAQAPDFSHKSDTGLVRLNLPTPEAVFAAATELLARLGDTPTEGLLVQRMITGGVETIVGISTDPQFGPVLAFGPGGVLVELLDDVALRLPPLTPAQALDMIRATKAGPLLQGFRGQPPADIAALTDLLVNLSHLACEHADTIYSLDFNPVIILPAGQGAHIVDARAFVR